MEHKIKLKDCPFCGGRAEIKCKTFGWGGNCTLKYVGCTKCGCRTQEVDTTMTVGISEQLKEMIDKWNTRV